MKKVGSILTLILGVFHECHCNTAKPSGCLTATDLNHRPDGYAVRLESVKSNLKSFAGFLNGTASSKMFFWFFPSEANQNNPLIIWLQGDIGTSSIKSIYENNGPWYVKEKRGTHLRKSYWSEFANVLYVDTAVGVGFSHSLGAQQRYPVTLNELVNNLFVTINSFFKIFNSYIRNDLYLAGDGFACPVLAKLATKIDQSSKKLTGLIIENGFCDPINVIPINQHLSSLKMYDRFRQAKFNQAEKQILDLLRGSRFVEAFDKYDELIKGLLTPYSTLFMNSTHYSSTENLLYDQEYRRTGNFTEYVTRQNVMCTLHLPRETKYRDGKNVLKNVRGELMMNSATNLGQLLQKYRILMYFGQMNPEITPEGAYLSATSIKWCGSNFFGDVYTPWRVNNTLAGYFTNVITGDCSSSFTWAMVRNAGKNVAAEKPEEVKDLVQKFLTQRF